MDLVDEVDLWDAVDLRLRRHNVARVGILRGPVQGVTTRVTSDIRKWALRGPVARDFLFDSGSAAD